MPENNLNPLIPRLEITAGSVTSEGGAFFTGTREAWLGYVVNAWRPYFARAKAPLPSRLYVSVGRPARGTSTGACHPGAASDDGAPYIFIHPVLSDPTRGGVALFQACGDHLYKKSYTPASRIAPTSPAAGHDGRRIRAGLTPGAWYSSPRLGP